MKRLVSLIIISLLSLTVAGCSFSKTKNEVSLTISPNGGSYELFRGASLTVPEGAVQGETDLILRKIQGEELESLESEYIQLVTAFEALPDGQVFAEPVTVTLEGLELDSGDIPLIRLLDEEGEIPPLVATTSKYDPGSGTLTFTIDHFTTYGVSVGEQVASQECLETPCRCGSISIQQSDSSASCSEDDCQILESEVSVQFNDCAGKPVENSYLKEISPSCQPRLEIKADRNKIQPEESTGVTAKTRISCIPIKEQTVDFEVDQLGQLNPTFRMTDEEGKAITTFTAGEEEGTAIVTANVTGSYYAFEVRANGETYNGPTKPYQLTESTEIEIGPLSGVLEGNYAGCNELVCLSEYQMRLEFTVDEINWEEGYWVGEGWFTQNGSLTGNNPDLALTDYEMISGIAVPMDGYAYKESKELDLLTVPIMLYAYDLFTWDMDCTGTGDCPIFEWSGGGYFIEWIGGNEGVKTFRLKMDGSDTPQQGPAYLHLMGSPPDIPGTYTLTLE
jgi:hypothetical protein